MDKTLPEIPAKRYFTIGEVSELCGVKAYVLRYWEQEFTQLRPVKRRGNRRYYQHHEVLLIRRIRELLYEEGFTISGARNRLSDTPATSRGAEVEVLQAPPMDATGPERDHATGQSHVPGANGRGLWLDDAGLAQADETAGTAQSRSDAWILDPVDKAAFRAELLTIRRLLEC
jgi:DNA-binding transcriptional MerR regulator